MSIKMLKEGILTKNWDNVKAAYENMTGEKLEVEKPKKKLGRPRKKSTPPKKEISLEAEIEADIDNKPPPKRKKRTTKPQVTKRKVGRREQIDTENRRMKFFDGGYFENQKVSKGNPFGVKITSMRDLGGYEPVEVQCESCRKYFEVSPVLAIKNFKCNDCICSGGQ